MRELARTMVLALLVVAGACEKREAATESTPPEPAAVEPAPEPPSAEDEEKRRQAERVAQALKKAEAEAAEEARRWTDDLKAKAVALRDRRWKNVKQALEAIVASEHRVPAHRERVAWRHPVETLLFFGITPRSRVVELGAGAGWYTEILAPLLAREGKLTVTNHDPNGPADAMTTVYGKRLVMFLEKSPELYGEVEVKVIHPPDHIDLGPAGSADLVLSIREMHNWHRRGHLDAYLAAVHAVLEDGGTFGVVAHRAAEGANADESAEKGYLPEAWVIEKVEAAGFELAGKSEINANPKDTKDYPDGVWTLPPSFRLGDKDRDKYAAIGESDRMTLRFVKKSAR